MKVEPCFIIGEKVRIKGSPTILEVKSVNDKKKIAGRLEKVAVVGYTKNGEPKRKEFLQSELEAV